MKTKTAGIMASFGIAALFAASTAIAGPVRHADDVNHTHYMKSTEADDCLYKKADQLLEAKYTKMPKSERLHSHPKVDGREFEDAKRSCIQAHGPLGMLKDATVIHPSPYKRPE